MMNKWDKFPARKTRKFAVWVEVAFLIALLRLIQYHVVEPVAAGEYYPDSSMYIDFDSSTILHGYTINARPPVYGMLLDFTEAVFGSYYLEATVAIQILCSALAVFVFTAIMGRLHIRGPWKQLVVLFFGASPAIAGWDHCILTESLSLSLAVFFFLFYFEIYSRTGAVGRYYGGFSGHCNEFFEAAISDISCPISGLLCPEILVA